MASCLLSSPRIHSPPDSLMRRTSVTKVSENRVFQQAATSNVPKRTHRGDWSGSLMGRSTNARFHCTMRYGAGSDSPKHPQLEKPDPGLTVRSRDADLHPFPISYLDEDSFVLFHLSSQQYGNLPRPSKIPCLGQVQCSRGICAYEKS